MSEEWKNHIAVMVLIKQKIMKADTTNLWPHHLPEVAAGEEQVLVAEKRIGHRLDEKYRSFLSLANGWKGFFQTVDLFGTNELSGSSMMEYALEILNAIEDDVMEQSGFSKEDLLPIAATRSNRDLFVISRPQSHDPGAVIWFAGEEIDRFPDFEEFFLAMADYNRAELEDLKAENKAF